MLARRLASGWLRRTEWRVYQVGPVAGPYAPEMAALLTCGRRAALSHGTGLGLHALRERVAGRPIEVSAAGSALERRAGITPHRVASLPPDDVTERHGMRVTTVPRTLVDVAGRTSERGLARLVEEAQLQGLVTPADLAAAVERARGRPGVGKLRAILARDEEPSLTRSEAEQRLRDLVRAAGLPMPQMNVRVGGFEVDAVWPAQRLIVEVDGYAYHSGRAAFERDHRKDARLVAHGWRALRVTWRQLVHEPETVVAAIAVALAAGTGTAVG